MYKRVFHILIIAVLALNLMGAWAFASAFDCGMECCKPGEWAGTISIEASSCCQMSDVTCGYETGQYEDLFDEAICCHSSVNKVSGEWDLNISSSLLSPSPTLRFPPSERFTASPQTTPIYLSNATLLC